MKNKLFIFIPIFLFVLVLTVSGCNSEPTYTAEEWEEKQKEEKYTKEEWEELQSSQTEENLSKNEETKTKTEVEIYNKELLEFREFMVYYYDLIKEFEDILPDSGKENDSNLTAKEILDLSVEEASVIKGIRVFPQYLTRYIEYDLEYIENRAIFFATIELLTDNGKIQLTESDHPKYTNELDNMLDSGAKRNNELRSIIIDFNNRAKELGLSIPFPNS